MNKVLAAILPIILTLVLLVTSCSAGSEPAREASLTAPAEDAHVGNLAPPAEGAQVGNLAPDFQLQSLDGKVVSLSELRGSPVMLNFWATWCPPCRNEMPYIQQIYEEWSGKGLVLLAIDIGESSSTVKEFVQSYELSFPVLLDIKEDVAQIYNITGIPTTFFIDKDGIIQDKRVGSFQSKEEIAAYLSKIIP